MILQVLVAPASILTGGGVTATNDMSGSVGVVSEETRKIMFRVKGSSMNFAGTKLADPNLAIYHLENGWTEVITSSSF